MTNLVLALGFVLLRRTHVGATSSLLVPRAARCSPSREEKSCPFTTSTSLVTEGRLTESVCVPASNLHLRSWKRTTPRDIGLPNGAQHPTPAGWMKSFKRFVDALMACPALILAMVLISALGTDLRNVVIAIAVIMVPLLARVSRGSVLASRNLPYVEAARTLGAGEFRIALRHILPNIVSPTIIVASGLGGSAVFAEASLSFLGFGVEPPNPSWGNILTDARPYLVVAPWMAIFPGIAIAILVLAFNLLGDSVSDVSDPRSSRGPAI